MNPTSRRLHIYAFLLLLSIASLAYAQNAPQAAAPGAYPIGWSTSSHFAYATSTYEDGIDAQEIHMAIMDLRTDSIVAEISDTTASGVPDPLAHFWKKHKAQISDLLKKWKVVQGNTSLHPFPLVYGTDTLMVKIQEECSNEEIMGFPVSQNIHVLLKSSSGQQKDAALLPQGFCGQDRATGYFLSPFEPRIVIALERNAPGWEGGATRTIHLFIGSRLNKGFR